MIKGNVEAILFQNSDNFYTVLKIDTVETNEDSDTVPTAIGLLLNIVKGDIYTFEKQVVNHPHYDRQLKAKTLEKEIPQTKEAIMSYLSNDLFKGVGKKIAQNVINTLGNNVINDILDDRSVLEKASGLPERKQKQAAEQISANQESERIVIHLHDLGLGPRLPVVIYRFYLDDTSTILDRNSHQLIYDIKGIGFSKADQPARNIGTACSDNE